MNNQGSLKFFFTIFLFLIHSCGFSDSLDDVFDQLKKDSSEKLINLPHIYNTNFVTGYLNMPSAFTSKEGNSVAGYAYFYPYQNIGVNFQLFTAVEAALNYKIFTGKAEDNFGKYGFGDDADRMANLKFSFDPSLYFSGYYPKVALGVDDFYGSKRFYSPYMVITNTHPNIGLEWSVGWGFKRMNGAFLGVNYSPFLQSANRLLQGSTLILEYDCNDYSNHEKEHPLAKDVISKVNLGLNLNLANILNLKVGSFRGKEIILQGSLQYNFGNTLGLLPKVKDPIDYKFPKNFEPIGHLRTEKETAYQLALALGEQGFYITHIFLVNENDNKLGLQIELINLRYWRNEDVKRKISSVIENLYPKNIDKITVTIQENSIPVESYVFSPSDERISYKLVEAVKKPTKYESTILFYRKKNVASWLLRPRLLSFFGSTSGKYKYALSMIGGPQGYLFDEMYYKMLLSYNIKSSIQNLSDIDYYDPSQLLAVRSDSVRYFQSQTVNLEQAYIQKGWNLGKGVYMRASCGYFEPAYAGVGFESLYFPVNSDFAFGIEAATVLKRNYEGLGFQWKVRKLNGVIPEYVPFVGVQYFLDAYYFYRPLQIELKASVGQFLAKDKGLELDIGKYYKSGLRIGYWMTVTNANDTVHDKIYYNKGISFRMPLDIFLTKSSRNFLGYGLAFWLRDSGAKAATGKDLYPTLIRARDY